MSNFQIQMTGKQITIELSRKVESLRKEEEQARKVNEALGGNVGRRRYELEHVVRTIENIGRFSMFLEPTTLYTLDTNDLAALGLFRGDDCFSQPQPSIF